MKGTMLVTAVLLLAGVDTHAGTATQVTITRIEVQAQGHFFLYLSSPILNGPSCARQPATAFVVDGSTKAGNTIIAVVAEAYALSKQITVTGQNSCKVHAGYETLFSVSTIPDGPPTQPGIRP
jgi:hypothetical protein